MNTFDTLGLKEELLSSIKNLGFEKPTPIQAEAIPHVISTDRDLLATAQTGTGKTAAFGLPILQNIDIEDKSVQAIILCPTRELCLQVATDLQSFSAQLKGVKIAAVYGGTSIENQIKKLKSGCQVVVGTPGRTLDLIRRNKLQITSIRYLVLDEADEMLSMGFQDDLDAILAGTPSDKQTLLFSATMPKAIVNMCSKYMQDHHSITVMSENKSAENVTHAYFVVNNKDRYAALKRLADVHPEIFGIVFCRTRRETKEVAEKLIQDGYNSDSLHGDLSQSQRDLVMNKFRSRQIQLLVATDVAARGLDVDDLTHVINYNLPDDLDLYVHRSGRTGRGSNKGDSLILVNSRELRSIKSLEKKLGKKVSYEKIPDGMEVCRKQLFTMIDKVENVEVNEDQIGVFIDEISKKLDWLSREELIKRFVSVEFNRFLSYYKKSKDLNADRSGKDGKDSRRRETNSDQFATFFLNRGRKHKMNPKSIFRLLDDQLSSKGLEIGNIEIFKNHSLVEIDKDYQEEIERDFQNATYKGEEVTFRPSQFTQKNRKSRKKKNPHRKFRKNRRKNK
ncbi:DEAD/DEAH box helicase [Membranihabitans maritimus]|uniref:DEAD/DEAH box helicase n=1 Tax=Membranihabitans maritimus TaxID=2904244 RepID=UPI001F46C7E9|nr:DEAD/DEAH box helicase [Membranihabitans maritimus]